MLLIDCIEVVHSQTLKVLLCVFLRLENNNVAFREKVPNKKRVEAEENGQSMKYLDVLSPVKYVDSDKDDPGQIEQKQTKSYGFGLIVILWELFSHVGEDKAEQAQ